MSRWAVSRGRHGEGPRARRNSAIPGEILRVFATRALTFTACVGLLATAACGGAGRPCGSPQVVETYYGAPGDPYFGGYSGDPYYGGDPGWYDPGAYDPGTDPGGDPGSSTGGTSSDPGTGDGSGSTGDPGAADPGSTDTGGDGCTSSDGTGDGTTSLRPHLRPMGTTVSVTTTTGPDASGCYECTMACTFQAVSGAPAGEVARGVDDSSYQGACQNAVVTLARQARSTGAGQLARCRPADTATAGHVIAAPTVTSTK